MNTSTFRRPGALLQAPVLTHATPCDEHSTCFNVWFSDSTRLAVRHWPAVAGFAAAWSVEDGEKPILGTLRDEAIALCNSFLLIHAEAVARHAANQEARASFAPRLPFPDEPCWSELLASCEATGIQHLRAADEDCGTVVAAQLAPVAPVVAAAQAVPVVVRRGGRCPHGAIRRFFAIAKEQQLNTRDKDGARRAVCEYFGIGVCSRSKLTQQQWYDAGTALKARRISWGSGVAVGVAVAAR